MTRINIRDYLHPRKEIDCLEENRLTQDQIDELLEAFTLYDKDEDGLIDTKSIATVMRAFGQIPTVCEETDIVAQYAQENCYEIDYKAFVKLVKSRYRIFDEDDELRESFRRFDKEDKGFVETEEIKKLLTTMGEPLTEKEVEEWLEDGKEFIRNGNLYYEDFATFMLSK